MLLNNLIYIVIGMAIVTYIPRLIPFVFINDLKENSFTKRFMKLIPYTALSALIFPGIITATNSTISAMIGGIVAIILSYLELNVVIVIVSSILSIIIFQLVI